VTAERVFFSFASRPQFFFLEKDMERFIAILGLLVQIGNAGAFAFEIYLPEHALIIAAVTGGIQAFIGKIQKPAKLVR
jgi:type IV secretory pathway VirB6-like protein